MERSANVFDLSFVQDGMKFDGDCKEEASEETSSPYKLDFVTDVSVPTSRLISDQVLTGFVVGCRLCDIRK